MTPFLKSLAQAFIQKALYGCAASAAAYFAGITTVPPPADLNAAALWQLLVIPAVTGLAGAIARWSKYDPARAN